MHKQTNRLFDKAKARMCSKEQTGRSTEHNKH